VERWQEIEDDASLLSSERDDEAMSFDLRSVPTYLLEQEIRRRDGIRDSARRTRTKYCDECIHFNSGACLLGHAMKLRLPRSMGDAVYADWGWHRKGCRDRLMEGEFVYLKSRKPFKPDCDELSEWEILELTNNPLAGEYV
jgi:hypothetical protein